jgi:hypothetical protein
MNYTLVYLVDPDCFKENKAVINEMKQVYVLTTDMHEFLKDKEGYLIPSEYQGEIILSEHIQNTYDLLEEYPEHFDWDIIGDHLPKYHSDYGVAENNDLQRYVDKELYEGEHDSEIAEAEQGCPDYLTKMQWVHHGLAESDTILFYKACEALVEECGYNKQGKQNES